MASAAAARCTPSGRLHSVAQTPIGSTSDPLATTPRPEARASIPESASPRLGRSVRGAIRAPDGSRRVCGASRNAPVGAHAPGVGAVRSVSLHAPYPKPDRCDSVAIHRISAPWRLLATPEPRLGRAAPVPGDSEHRSAPTGCTKKIDPERRERAAGRVHRSAGTGMYIPGT
jgi:hypothetical protein